MKVLRPGQSKVERCFKITFTNASGGALTAGLLDFCTIYNSSVPGGLTVGGYFGTRSATVLKNATTDDIEITRIKITAGTAALVDAVTITFKKRGLDNIEKAGLVLEPVQGRTQLDNDGSVREFIVRKIADIYTGIDIVVPDACTLTVMIYFHNAEANAA